MEEAKQPILLPDNGKASLFQKDAEIYGDFLATKDRLETLKAIQNGMSEIKNGLSKTSDQFFQDFFQKYNINHNNLENLM